MYQCARCGFEVAIEDSIKKHLLEEHGLNCLTDFYRLNESEDKTDLDDNSEKLAESGDKSIEHDVAGSKDTSRIRTLTKKIPDTKPLIKAPAVTNAIESEVENKGKTGVKTSCKPKIRGQTYCGNCGNGYNNRSRPKRCCCGQVLKKAAASNVLNAFALENSIYSVREHRAGIGKRVIVDTNKKVCYGGDCLDVRAHYDEQNKFNCLHVKACESQAL